VANLRAFRAMRAGYSSGNFVYGLFTARKPSTQLKSSIDSTGKL